MVCLWAVVAPAEGVAVILEAVVAETNDGAASVTMRVAAVFVGTVLVAAGVSVVLTRLAEVIGVVEFVFWALLEVFTTLIRVSISVILVFAAMAMVIGSLAVVVGTVDINIVEVVDGFRNFETFSEAAFVVNESVAKEIGKDFVAAVVVIGGAGAVTVFLANILVLTVETATVGTMKFDVEIAVLILGVSLVAVRKEEVFSWTAVVAVWVSVMVPGTTAEVVGAVLLTVSVVAVAAVVVAFVKLEVAVAATRLVLG